jgi:hypothetical protein
MILMVYAAITPFAFLQPSLFTLLRDAITRQI